MEFVDLKKQQSLIKSQIDINIQKVLNHGRYIMGPEVSELEEKLADYVGVKHCVSVSSGSDALLIAMMAIGIGLGDEVITTPFTFVATVEMIVLLGAKPVFVDIDVHTYNINHTKIESAITSKTRLILPVSLYGQCANMEVINKISNKYGLPVLEDGAQSFGATYKGKKSCGLSTVGCTSFFPSKPLGCYGDGGAIFTNDDYLAKKIRQIRLHGQESRYHHTMIGINGRLDTIQAAILLAKFDIFPKEVEMRQKVGEKYNQMFSKVDTLVKIPYIDPECTTVYGQYTISISNREQRIKKMQAANIPSVVHYPVPLHMQPAFLTEEFELPCTEKIAKKVLSLPMHPYLTDADLSKVVLG
jgi:UDP-2-acetamido-2-deoxy-ribo-hexuluronate aminotransferase